MNAEKEGPQWNVPGALHASQAGMLAEVCARTNAECSGAIMNNSWRENSETFLVSIFQIALGSSKYNHKICSKNLHHGTLVVVDSAKRLHTLQM